MKMLPERGPGMPQGCPSCLGARGVRRRRRRGCGKRWATRPEGEGCPRFPQPKGLAHIFRLAWGRGGGLFQSVEGVGNGQAEGQRVNPVTAGLPGLGCGLIPNLGLQETIQGREHTIAFLFSFSRPHQGLEEVVVEVQQGIEGIEGLDLSHGVQATVAHIGADMRAVVLLDKAVVVFVIGAAAGKGDLLLLEKGPDEVVEELRAVIAMDFQDGEGDAPPQGFEGVSHDQAAVAQGGVGSDPTAEHIGPAQGKGEETARGAPVVEDGIAFQVARLGDLSGDNALGHRTGDSGFAARGTTGSGQAGGLAAHRAHDAAHGADTDLLQLRFDLWGEGEVPMTGQVAGCGQQYRLQPFGARVIQGLGAALNGFTGRWSVSGAPLALAGLAAQVAPEQPQQAFAVQTGHGFHLGQKDGFLASTGLLIQRLHLVQIFAAFVDVHRFLG